MAMFKENLKENVKDELMWYVGTLDSLEELIVTLMNLNDKLFEWQWKWCQGRQRSEMTSHLTNISMYWGFKQHDYDTQKSEYYELMFMKLDAMIKQCKKNNLRDKWGNKNIKKCYTCDKLNHFTWNCRKKMFWK